MSKYQTAIWAILRVAMGWLFFHAGIVKVMNPAWSAAGYLKGAVNFTGFFGWLSSPGILPVTNFLNEWGLTLIGASLILGVFVRKSAVLGALMMVLYYLVLDFPKPDANSFIVDDHVIYALVLLALAAVDAGRYWGLEGKVKVLGR